MIENIVEDNNGFQINDIQDKNINQKIILKLLNKENNNIESVE